MPAFGRPTSAASASSFRCSSTSRSSPGKPDLGEPRHLPGRADEARVAAAAAAAAREHDAGLGMREVGDQVVAVEHLRPDRHAHLDVLAVGAVLAGAAAVAALRRRDPAAGAAAPTGRAAPGSAMQRSTSPPLPPSPPSGPPFGTYFSRRNERAPSPPRPALTWNCALSLNMPRSAARSSVRPSTTATKRRSPLVRNSALPSRTAKIVSSLPIFVPGAGTELRAALADDDLAGADVLAAEDLHAEVLRVRVAPVLRRAESFLMCHLRRPPPSSSADSSAAIAPLRAAFACSYASAASSSSWLHSFAAASICATVMSRSRRERRDVATRLPRRRSRPRRGLRLRRAATASARRPRPSARSAFGARLSPAAFARCRRRA